MSLKLNREELLVAYKALNQHLETLTPIPRGLSGLNLAADPAADDALNLLRRVEDELLYPTEDEDEEDDREEDEGEDEEELDPSWDQGAEEEGEEEEPSDPGDGEEDQGEEEEEDDVEEWRELEPELLGNLPNLKAKEGNKVVTIVAHLDGTITVDRGASGADEDIEVNVIERSGKELTIIDNEEFEWRFKVSKFSREWIDALEAGQTYRVVQ